ncbi:hypothetical protein MPSEU_000693600 [Mayamaea pseudoterrestris]|nr:hypothetical protein MPSEU_000693600 [Mayamaea pseudoterrestris]
MSFFITKNLCRNEVSLLIVKSTITAPQQRQAVRSAHTVRVIVRADIPPKAYEGDILSVKAGFARNYLIPQKKVVYATRQNFEKFGLQDPDLETTEQRRDRLAKEASHGEDLDLKAADILKHYLRNKSLKLWRNADASTGSLTSGSVDAKYIRKKLSKQLRIDLEPHETITLRAEPVNHAELDHNPTELQSLIDALASDQASTTQVKQLGEFLACISLRGGYNIPLRVEVLKR